MYWWTHHNHRRTVHLMTSYRAHTLQIRNSIGLQDSLQAARVMTWDASHEIRSRQRTTLTMWAVSTCSKKCKMTLTRQYRTNPAMKTRRINFQVMLLLRVIPAVRAIECLKMLLQVIQNLPWATVVLSKLRCSEQKTSKQALLSKLKAIWHPKQPCIPRIQTNLASKRRKTMVAMHSLSQLHQPSKPKS